MCAETTKDGSYFLQVAPDEYVLTAVKEEFTEFRKDIDVIESETTTVDVELKAEKDTTKSFLFSCEHGMERGSILGLETLNMNIGDTENCTLELTNHEPGKTVTIATLLREGFRSSIEIEPESGETDEEGKVDITITAIRKGKDWAAWAVPNDIGEFEFNKETYDTGLAWGMFVDVE